MHPLDDDLLEATDDIDATLAAARGALEVLAANNLGFSAQTRVHRNSTRRARTWLLEHLDTAPLPTAPSDESVAPSRDDHTDEILAHALKGERLNDQLDLDEESGLVNYDESGLVDGLDDDHSASDQSLSDLVQIDELEDLDELSPLDSIDDLEDLDGIDDFDELDEDGHSDQDMVAYEEDQAFVTIDGTDLMDYGESNDLVQFDEPDEDGGLVTFEDDPDVVAIGQGGDSLIDRPIDELVDFEQVSASDELEPERESRKTSPDETLVTDLESLVRLGDQLEQESDDGPALVSLSDGNGDRGVKTTLTEDDLGALGFASSAELISPEGSDQDPHSEEAPQPKVSLRTSTKAAPSAVVAAVPTIRDQSPGNSARSTAAIQLKPGGGSAIVQQVEVLEMGSADEDWEDDHSGSSNFALEVEEFEYEDIEEPLLEEIEEPEIVAPPPPLPTMSSGEQLKMIQAARAEAQSGDLQTAAQLYGDVLDFNPDNTDALLGRGRIYLDLGDYARAMSDFTVAEDIDDNNPECNAAMGELYYARKDYTRAIDYFDRTLSADPKHAMALCRRGIAHYYRKNYQMAYSDLVMAEKLDDSIGNIRTFITMADKRRK